MLRNVTESQKKRVEIHGTVMLPWTVQFHFTRTSFQVLARNQVMFIATGTDGEGKKIILRAKKDMMLFEYTDGQLHFFSGPHLSNVQMQLDKETSTERILCTARNKWDKFPIGTFTSLINETYCFEYEKLVPDTNITVSAFEKMQKEAADMKKEIERLKTVPAKPVIKAKAKAKTKATIPTSTDTQEATIPDIL